MVKEIIIFKENGFYSSPLISKDINDELKKFNYLQDILNALNIILKIERNKKMNRIKIEKLQDKLKEVFKKGYDETIELKFNGQIIPNFDILRFLIPTKENLIYLKKYPIKLKINGEYYEVLKWLKNI